VGLQELFRRHTNDALEISSKVTLIAKTYPGSNVCNAEFAMLQQIFGFIDPTLQNVLVGRYSPYFA
jgi:hypothetical protein